jgi:hypothetical protein
MALSSYRSHLAPIAYLGSWAFVALIIAVRFMIVQRPFRLKTLAQAEKNTLYFKQHFKVACDILSPLVHTCFFFFFFWNNSLGNKWFNFNILFQNVIQ